MITSPEVSDLRSHRGENLKSDPLIVTLMFPVILMMLILRHISRLTAER
jgi:hypothetical protein